LLKASFIPSSEQQAVRDLTRTRTRLIQERNRLVNRVQKVLEDANIKLASVVSDIMGMTGHAILTALVAGQEDPERLAHLAQGKLIKKQEQLKAALQGKLISHHRVLLGELLQLIATLDRSIAGLDREIAERLRQHDALIERIDEVTGLSRRSIARVTRRVGMGYESFSRCCSCCFVGWHLSGEPRAREANDSVGASVRAIAGPKRYSSKQHTQQLRPRRI
jgi:transposase